MTTHSILWRRRATVLIFAILLTALTIPLDIARAGSPFDDPTFQPPQGGTTSAAGPHPITASLPAGYTEIPPPSSIALKASTTNKPQ